MNGFMYISDNTIYSEEVYSPIEDFETITNNQTIYVYFKALAAKMHITRPPEGVNFPSKSISKQDVEQNRRLWHETAISRSYVFSKSTLFMCDLELAFSYVADHLEGILSAAMLQQWYLSAK